MLYYNLLTFANYKTIDKYNYVLLDYSTPAYAFIKWSIYYVYLKLDNIYDVLQWDIPKFLIAWVWAAFFSIIGSKSFIFA